jgi:hypothetical protein
VLRVTHAFSAPVVVVVRVMEIALSSPARYLE